MEFSEIIGETFIDIAVNDTEIVFTSKTAKYLMNHIQDCCESVYVEDICGDLDDLIGSPIINAEEVISNEESEEVIKANANAKMMSILKGERYNNYKEDSETWTFYKLDTAKGGVTIRWYGSSNGYYSETVDFNRVSES